MATSADIAVQSSNYVGDKNLGGAGGGAFTFDLSPLEKLAAYTNLQNKTFWDQKQKNAEKVVDQLAAIADLDVNSLYGADKDKTIEEMRQLRMETQETLRNAPSDPDEYMRWYNKARSKMGEVAGRFETRKQRALDRVAQLNLIKEKHPNNPELQEIDIKAYDELFNKTDGRLENMSLWQPVEIPKPPVEGMVFDVIRKGSNSNVTQTLTVLDPEKLYANVNAAVTLGATLRANAPKKTVVVDGKEVSNPAYEQWAKGKSADEIRFAETQNVNPQSAVLYNEIAENYKSIISNPKYFDENGKFKEAEFLAQNKGVIADNYNAVKDMTNMGLRYQAQFDAGIYNDSEGLGFNLTRTVDKNSFDRLIVRDPRNIDATTLGMANAVRGWQDKVTNKETKTDYAERAKERAKDLSINASTQAGQDRRALWGIKAAQGEKYENGKWVKPKNAATVQSNGGVVPFWQNTLLPQLNKKDLTKQTRPGVGNAIASGWTGTLTPDYTGRIPLRPDAISGLETAIYGSQTTYPGEIVGSVKPGALAIGKNTEVFVEYEKGIPIGLVIEGKFFNVDEINKNATIEYNKNISGSVKTTVDKPIHETENAGTVVVPGL